MPNKLYILALRSIASVLSCIAACWFCICQWSCLSATIINEKYYYYDKNYLELLRVQINTTGQNLKLSVTFKNFKRYLNCKSEICF